LCSASSAERTWRAPPPRGHAGIADAGEVAADLEVAVDLGELVLDRLGFRGRLRRARR